MIDHDRSVKLKYIMGVFYHQLWFYPTLEINSCSFI